jgi:hypothetical protein
MAINVSPPKINVNGLESDSTRHFATLYELFLECCVLYFQEYYLIKIIYFFSGEKQVDRTSRKRLFDATELEDADVDDVATSNNGVPSPVNGSSSNFIKILTSLLDSTVTTILTIYILK